MIVERLAEEGVHEERILVIGPKRSMECTKLGRDVTVLLEPVARKKLHQAIETAAAAEIGEEREVTISLPSTLEKTAAKDEMEKGSAGGGFERTEEVVSDMLLSFERSARELLDSENLEELEETALQLKQELERYGFGETKETLFKLVLAARKKKTTQIKKILEDLKATGDSLTMSK